MTRPPAGQSARTDFITGVVIVAITGLLCIMLGRVAQLQIAPGSRLADHMDERITTAREPGIRGDILDRRGRLLAGSRFGFRIFVDPTRFPIPADDAMMRLADATGLPMEYIASRIAPKMAENERRATLQGGISELPDAPDAPASSIDDPDAKPPPLIRYVTVGPVLDDWRVEVVRALKIPGVYLETRSVRENTAPDITGPLVGKVGIDHNGLYGAELMLDKLIRPSPGRLQYVRDASNRPLWVERGGYIAPQRGKDVRLSIDLELQRIATEELERGVKDADAAGGRLVLLDPITGEIVAMVDLIRPPPDAVPFDWDNPFATGRRYQTIKNPGLVRNRCVEDIYEPGSTFKPFMWAAATELGLADPDEVIDTGNGTWITPYGRSIEDVVKRGQQTWAEVLVNSSNIGMAKITRRMTDKQMHDAVRRFGFGARTRVGLPGESPGIVTTLKHWTVYTQTSVAMGHEVAVTPLQMVHAYAAFARTGELAGTLPPLRLVSPETEASAVELTRVLPANVANLARQTMRGVAHNLDLRMAKRDDEAPPRYDLFAKSGTAEIPIGKAPPGKKRPRGFKGYYPNQYNSSFIAAGPSEAPRLICVVVIDDPGPSLVRARRHYGASVAGPVVRRVMERSLAYLGAPPSFADVLPMAEETPAKPAARR